MIDILSTKEIIKYVTLGIPKEMKKYSFFCFCHYTVPFAFAIDILIRNENRKTV